MDKADKSGNNYQTRQYGQKARAEKGRGLDQRGDQVRAKGKRWGQLVSPFKILEKWGSVPHCAKGGASPSILT